MASATNIDEESAYDPDFLESLNTTHMMITSQKLTDPRKMKRMMIEKTKLFSIYLVKSIIPNIYINKLCINYG